MSKTRLITFNGETMPISLWATRTGLSRQAIANRLESRWSVEDTLTLPRGAMRSYRVRKIRLRPVPQPRPVTTVPKSVAHLLRANMASQRAMTIMLRQFNRDLMLIMERTLDRGEGDNLPEKPSDQTLSTAQDRV
jgi:hypothetical protein